MRIYLIVIGVLLSGCVGLPENVQPVASFSLDRYLGKWYEIARMDHSFEHDLTRVTAEYSLREDGGMRVLNRGYNAKSGKWQEVEGKAYFVDGSNVGFLKVSFFGPFYGSYIVVDLDQDGYQYSLVSGPDKSFMWILSRSARISNEVRDRLIQKARNLGFDTDKVLFVEQDS